MPIFMLFPQEFINDLLVSNYFPVVKRYSGKLSKLLCFADDLKLFIS